LPPRKRSWKDTFQTSQHKAGPPVFRFTPYAWAKLITFRDAGDTEIGGFGITGISGDDLLLVEDFVTVRQAVTAVTVAFDDAAVAEFFDQQVDLGRRPEQFGRIWIHTHPGRSASPSSTDEETFERAFGTSQWAVMFILAKGGETYCRLRFNVGPGAAVLLNTTVEYHHPFAAADLAAWSDEYDQNVIALPDRFGLDDIGLDTRLRRDAVTDQQILDDWERERLADAEDLLNYGIEVFQ
jgi:hypothetical protein